MMTTGLTGDISRVAPIPLMTQVLPPEPHNMWEQPLRAHHCGCTDWKKARDPDNIKTKLGMKGTEPQVAINSAEIDQHQFVRSRDRLHE